MNTFNAKNLKRIGVYTSGGDAPGMNAAIRAAVRMAIFKNIEVYGIFQGYQGMIDKQIKPLELGSMANVIQRGGTVLKSGRCKDFHMAEARALAAQNLKDAGIQALICIGGDGSFRGAKILWEEHQIPTMGVPGTIDNDINGSEYTIGFDTAVNTALEAIDKIRDTAASHDRLFIVEVMGRNTGYIAIEVGLAGGAEEVFFPEHPFDLQRVVNKVKKGMERGKKSSILVTAEGPTPGYAYEIAQKLKDEAGFSAKVCILGHIQRGGSPTALDRMVASRFSALAVEKLLQGHCNAMIGLQGTSYKMISFDEAVQKKPFSYEELLDLVNILSQ
ncbi:MAG: 6-phosphofructokinase [Bdellovibrionaceae bacterium]|nr:6-phosphofructokinase [Pseudobdellovibrionaceae bacterium]